MKFLILALIILQANCSKQRFYSEREIPEVIRISHKQSKGNSKVNTKENEANINTDTAPLINGSETMDAETNTTTHSK